LLFLRYRFSFFLFENYILIFEKGEKLMDMLYDESHKNCSNLLNDLIFFLFLVRIQAFKIEFRLIVTM